MTFPVYCPIYLDQPDYRPLKAPGALLPIRQSGLSEARLGYGGLLVVHAVSEAERYYAFDLACPHEYSREILLVPDGLNVRCPQCHSLYEVLSGSGAPISGPSRRSLKAYHVGPVRMGRIVVTN